jgi:transcriptional regulator with XRE-family HTH domain
LSSPTFTQLLAPLYLASKPLLARNLKSAREKAGLTQEEAAAQSGFSKQAISGWERGAYKPTEENLETIAQLYRTTVIDLRYSDATIEDVRAQMGEGRLMVSETFSPNPALRKRLRPKPYARVYEHIAKLEAAGVSIDQIEEAERTMIDGAFNQLNKRDPRDRTDEEMIMDIDSAWRWIKEVLGRSGISGLE